jgi:hypothetical protein
MLAIINAYLLSLNLNELTEDNYILLCEYIHTDSAMYLVQKSRVPCVRVNHPDDEVNDFSAYIINNNKLLKRNHSLTMAQAEDIIAVLRLNLP